MLKDLASQKKIEPEVVLAAIKALQEKGWDINPYTVADEAKIPRSTLYRSTELMNIVSQARVETPGAATAGDHPVALESSTSPDSRLAELEKRNQELEQLLAELKNQNETLAKEQQEAWQNGYKAALQEQKAQDRTSPTGDTIGGDRKEEFSAPHAGSDFFDPAELAADFNPSMSLFASEPQPIGESLFVEEKSVLAEPVASAAQAAPPPPVVPPPPPIQIDPPKVAVSHKLDDDGWSSYGSDSETGTAEEQNAQESTAELESVGESVNFESVALGDSAASCEPVAVREPAVEALPPAPFEPDMEPVILKEVAGDTDVLSSTAPAAASDQVQEAEVASTPAEEAVESSSPAEPASANPEASDSPDWGAPSFEGYFDPTQSLFSQDYGDETLHQERDFQPTDSPGAESTDEGFYEPNEDEIEHKIKTTTLTEDELSDLLKHRFGKSAEEPVEKKEDEAAKKAAGTRFVGGHRAQQEPPPQGFVVRTVPPDIRKACLVLGLRPEEITMETVHKAWKTEMTREHPDKGGDNEIAVYLNTAKDTLYRWLEAQAPKLGKKFGTSTMQFRKPTDKEVADAAAGNKEDNK